MIQITKDQLEKIFVHARRELPHECCGLLGGRNCFVNSVYNLKNVAANSLIEYEAAVEDLLIVQRTMRERRETLVGIYHSHPQQGEPRPSETDVARAFYPEAVYFIIGFKDNQPVLRAFRIYEHERRSEQIDFFIVS